MAHEHRLHRLAVLRAVAEHDAQALHSLTLDLTDEQAEVIIRRAFAETDIYTRRLALKIIDWDSGEAWWRHVVARWQADEVAQYLAEQGGSTTPGQA